MIAQLDVLLTKNGPRYRRVRHARINSSAARLQNIRAIGAGKCFGHRTSADISHTDEKYFLGTQSYTLPRKSSWMRGSVVSSGWKVATRCLPCSTSTGSPLYRAST